MGAYLTLSVEKGNKKGLTWVNIFNVNLYILLIINNLKIN